MYRRKRRYGYKRRRKYGRSYRRAPRKYRRVTRSKGNTLHVRRGGSAIAVSTNPASTVYLNSAYFSLNSIINPTDFTNLFDEYRINCVVLKFIPRSNYVQNLATTATAANNYLPTLHWVVDLNDSNVPSNVDSLLEYNGYHCRNFTRTVTIKIRPKFSLAAYSGAFTSYKPTKGWIDTGSPNVQHYGLKFAIDSVLPNQYIDFVIRPIYYVSFRRTK